MHPVIAQDRAGARRRHRRICGPDPEALAKHPDYPRLEDRHDREQRAPTSSPPLDARRLDHAAVDPHVDVPTIELSCASDLGRGEESGLDVEGIVHLDSLPIVCHITIVMKIM